MAISIPDYEETIKVHLGIEDNQKEQPKTDGYDQQEEKLFETYLKLQSLEDSFLSANPYRSRW